MQSSSQLTTRAALAKVGEPLYLDLDPVANPYPVIAKRPGAKVYDTIFAAIIQAWLIINGDGTKLLWVSKKNTDEVAAARAALEALKRKGDRVTNAQTIQLWRAWGLFVILIERAESLNLRVFDDDAYGRPQSVTWIEFVGIVSYLAANIMQCITDAETAAKGGALSLSVYTILQDISRIRRYYRSKMDGSGARRNQHDWNIIYSFLEKIDDPAVNIDNEIGTNVMDGLAFGPEPDLGF